MLTRSNRGRKTKSKLGCRTCKIRKVKCDEGRPACHRCVSTGRVCDGYGVWGGGGNGYGTSSRWTAAAEHGTSPAGNSSSLRPRPTASVCTSIGSAIGITSSEENASFEWFVVRAIKKLPGSFGSAFWDTLIFQAVASERAVLHAVLALSSTHQRAALDGVVAGTPTPLDAYERFTLRQYSKSIRHLQPHLEAARGDRAAIRVMLVACAVFTSLESLRGCYASGCVHLRSGLQLLREYLASSSSSTTASLEDGALGLGLERRSRDPTDDGIAGVFARLYVQAKLLGQGFRDLQPIPNTLVPRHIPMRFASFREARLFLDHLLSSVICLTEKCQEIPVAEVNASTELLSEQWCLKSRLTKWYAVLRASVVSLQEGGAPLDTWSHRLLRLYYKMTYIMVETCLGSSSESAYDPHTDLFAALLAHSTETWELFTSGDTEALLGHQNEAFKCSLDLGGSPPLYYTALKCRVRRIRLHAARLIDAIAHKAGFWDTTLTAAVARKVIEIEEGDFYASSERRVLIDDDFPLSSVPEDQDLSLLPVLPESRRVQNVRVVLPGDPAGVLTLSCTRKPPGGSHAQETIVKEYNLVSQSWRACTVR
ncbi:hypothetical protein SLS62_006506 [Diatrype stigma]|uniref:Zn(2)-C6 fungal-type domain-containing protein n=1 Tax=Diatrype stigma TaxID=117547 RepID=A0AAN9UPC5_9PEZI